MSAFFLKIFCINPIEVDFSSARVEQKSMGIVTLLWFAQGSSRQIQVNSITLGWPRESGSWRFAIKFGRISGGRNGAAFAK
jgi:hypothetical protein